MKSYVALLRAVNLAGLNRVPMADLRGIAGRLGLAEPRTLLQSGNLVFRGSGDPARLERALREATSRELGVETDFFVRSGAEWAALVDGNPFEREARSDPGHLIALICSEPVSAMALASLRDAIQGREIVRTAGRPASRHAYIFYPDGIGRSRLTMTWIEKKLGLRGTGRNWNTVVKILAALRD